MKYFKKFFFILIFIFKIKTNLIVLPFQVKEITKNKKQYIYTSFEMGEPPQNIETELSFQSSNFFMTHNNNSVNGNVTFNPSSSQTFLIISNNISISDIEKGYLAIDNLYFFTDINCENKKKYSSIPIVFPQDKNISFSLIIGLQIGTNNKSYNFINLLKSNNIINNYYFTIKFTNLNKGLIIIGDLPHIYDKNKYIGKKLKFINAYSIKNKIYWGMHISSIKFYGLTISDNMIGRIEPKILEIFASYEYITSIEKIYFQKYIENQICRRIWDELDGEDIFRFICEKDKFNKSDINDFPPLIINNVNLNYSFEFNGNDLFHEKDDKIVFQIVAKAGRTNGEWLLGRIFLYKYQIIYDNDNNLIGIYIEDDNNNKNKQNIISENNQSLLIVLIIILIIILLLMIGWIAYMIYMKKGICKNRKKRISELDDDFVYSTNE